MTAGLRTRAGAQDSLTMRLETGGKAAASARRALGRLRGDLDAPLMETMRLLVTELVTNSVRHAGGRAVELKVIVTRTAVLTEVRDAGPGFVPATEARRSVDEEDRGWGLFLVRRLADRWGVRRDGHRTSVWFELRRLR